MDLHGYCVNLAERAQGVSLGLAEASSEKRAAALRAMADRLDQQRANLKEQNAKDLAAGEENGLSAAMIDRLRLTDQRIDGMVDSVRRIAEQDDPLGRVIEESVRPNGLVLQKVRVPIGVILIIFESRPNVTSDAAALCIKSGNAVILRGGKEAFHSNGAIAACVREGLELAGMAPDCAQLVEVKDRAAVGELLKMTGKIDLAIPRGGESLIRSVVEQAHIPVIKHYTGNCHVYVDSAADERMALDICVNAKTQRPGVCNAAETILFHRDAVQNGLLSRVCEELHKNGVEVRGDATVCERFANAVRADDADWGAEYLDLIVAARVVDSIENAIAHINRYGSKHTDAIVTGSDSAAERFVQGVDSANVMVNCSTRFSDGGEYGLGAEIGISTDKLHARGPMGAADLTTYKWVVRGTGQVRA